MILEIKDKLNLEVVFLFIVLCLIIFSIIQINNKKKIENTTILNELNKSNINQKDDIFINNRIETIKKTKKNSENSENLKRY